EIFPIINQDDARVENFEIQFLKEAAKFVGDFKSLEKEADESLAKHKLLELEIEHLLRAVVSQDLISVVQNNSVDETSNLQTELEHTLNPLSQKLENENMELEFQVLNYAKENAHLKTTYKNLFDSISVTRTQTRTIIDSLQNKLQDTIYENAKLRAQLFNNVSEQKDITRGTRLDNTKTRRTQPRSNIKNDRVPSASKSSCSKNKEVEVEVEEQHRKLLLSRNKKHMSSACNNVKLATQNVKFKKQTANVLINEKQKKQKPKVKKTKKVGSIERLASHKPSKPRSFLRWSPTGRLNRTTNLYTINLYEMASASPICLMAHATSTKSWLLHQHLSHLNFDTINDLTQNDLVTGLLKFKYHKEHLCPSCEQGKSKSASHPPKPFPNSRQRLHLVHMDLCGPMRIASINGKRYVLVIVDDYSRYTWVHFLRSKDEAPENDREDIGKLGAKGDFGFFIGYSADSCAYRVYNRRTKKIMETMNVTFE
nr:ribonuclease H-like domain-containing protein [Tanacetum cinerariifolium]